MGFLSCEPCSFHCWLPSVLGFAPGARSAFWPWQGPIGVLISRLTEQPASFRAWLLGVVAEPDQTHTTKRIATRLLVMPMASRRNAADAMTGRAFWEPFAGQEGSLKTVQRQVRDGVLMALQSSPTAGDLYLTAAWLEALTDGFGLRGRELLRAITCLCAA